MRDRITTALEVAGLALISFGAYLIHPSAGFIVAGSALVAAGVALGGAE